MLLGFKSKSYTAYDEIGNQHLASPLHRLLNYLPSHKGSSGLSKIVRVSNSMLSDGYESSQEVFKVKICQRQNIKVSAKDKLFQLE